MNNLTSNNRRTKKMTITLEIEVADSIQEILSKNKELKENELINKLLRLGIKAENTKPQKKFEIISYPSGLQPGVTIEEIERLLDEI